jgi:hypothetical protein
MYHRPRLPLPGERPPYVIQRRTLWLLLANAFAAGFSLTSFVIFFILS